MQSEQIRAARALLDWNQARLADASGVSATTIKRMEAGNGPVKGSHENVLRLQQALEIAGVEFIPAGGYSSNAGPGVRLRHASGNEFVS